jgi:hypothetical protein
MKEDLGSLLALLSDAGATDPRDKIYALLSLARDGEAIDVDYSKPVNVVYLDVANHIVDMADSAPWVLVVASYFSPEWIPDSNRPSWVPTWQRRGYVSNLKGNATKGSICS